MTTLPYVNCVLFSTPNGQHSNVTVNGVPKGDIQRVSGTQWEYQHGCLELAGSYMDVCRRISAHYAGQAA